MGGRSGWMAALAVLAAGVLSGPVLAAGGSASGGGMGNMSSASRGVDPAKAYQEGVTALNAGDYRTAVAKLRLVIDAAPNDATMNYAYGRALVGANEFRDARRPLEKAVRGDNPRADARRLLGVVYLQIEQREKAQGQLDALAAELAACDAACGDARRAQLQAAHDALKQAMEGGAATAPTTGWILPGAEAGRTAYADAVGLINQARYTEALAALERAKEAAGPHPDVLNYMGFANRKLGRYEEARRHYEAALAIDPGHRGATEYLGELYLELGLIPQAERQLARLDRLCPYGCAEREELSRWIAGAR